jgi:signal transduction histidine kinase
VSGIARRVVISNGLLVLLAGAAFAVMLFSVADLRRSERLVLRSQEVLATANEMERLVVDLETAQRGFVITGQALFLEPWYAARPLLPAQARTLERLVEDKPAQQSRARRITAQTESYVSDYAEPLLATARRDPASARTLAVTEEGKRRVDALRAEFDDLTATERTLSLGRETQSDTIARRAAVAAATGLGASVLLILAFAVYLTRVIVRPVLRTTAMAERVAGGDLSVRVPESGVAEIRTLERGFNTMAGSLGHARAQLADSRARIVTSSDETRRRIERDLHDGIQQRLVSLALNLRAIQANLPAEPAETGTQLDRLADGMEGALDELREISRGIHPAILSEGGLGPALKVLARRSAIPVEVDPMVESRLAPQAEVAAYYVVAEALTNATKHARASVVHVTVQPRDARLHLSVRDDGCGGADPARGTGLTGLTDRIQALGGTITIHSPKGQGTTLRVELPMVPSVNRPPGLP